MATALPVWPVDSGALIYTLQALSISSEWLVDHEQPSWVTAAWEAYLQPTWGSTRWRRPKLDKTKTFFCHMLFFCRVSELLGQTVKFSLCFFFSSSADLCNLRLLNMWQLLWHVQDERGVQKPIRKWPRHRSKIWIPFQVRHVFIVAQNRRNSYKFVLCIITHHHGPFDHYSCLCLSNVCF